MSFTFKRRNDKGLASIVIVSMLVVLITLVTLGFARIMSRATHNALNNQLSAAASYAAQSGINDAISYLKTNPSASSTKCSDLSGVAPFNNANLSGDGTTGYTCVLISQNPPDLLYQQLPPEGSQIVKATTANPVDQFMFSWQSTDRTKTSQPSNASNSLLDETTWNSNGYTPILRVSLYPIPDNGQLSNVEAASKTFFFYPTNGGGQVTKIPYATADGTLQSVNCGTQTVAGFSGTADYDCNVIVHGLGSAMPGVSYFYLRFTPIYGQADVKVQANGNGSSATTFTNSQAVLDVTGKSGTAVKRLQARVDVSGSGGSASFNISPSEQATPDFALRSALAICKRLNVQPGIVTVDSSYCNLNVTPPPPPTVVAGSPSNVGAGSATLNGTVNPNGKQVTDCHFDYGPSLNYGSSKACAQNVGAGNSPVAVSADISGLSDGTTYYFRLCATNIGGQTCDTGNAGGGGGGNNGSGGDTFKTPPLPPTASLTYNGPSGSSLSFAYACGHSTSAKITLSPGQHSGGSSTQNVDANGTSTTIGGPYQPGDSGNATLDCTGAGGSKSASTSWTVAIPDVHTGIYRVDAYDNFEHHNLCGDNVHDYVICVYWTWTYTTPINGPPIDCTVYWAPPGGGFINESGTSRYGEWGPSGSADEFTFGVNSVPKATGAQVKVACQPSPIFGGQGGSQLDTNPNGYNGQTYTDPYAFDFPYNACITASGQLGPVGGDANNTCPSSTGSGTGGGGGPGGGQNGGGSSGGGGPTTVTCSNGQTVTSPPGCQQCTFGGTAPSCVGCWNGTTATDSGQCPAQTVTCTYGGTINVPPGCSVCWDGSTATSSSNCPPKPVCRRLCNAYNNTGPPKLKLVLERYVWKLT